MAIKIEMSIAPSINAKANMDISGDMQVDFGPIQKVNVSDYEKCKNKPRINHVELIGDKSASELELLDNKNELTVEDINEAWAAIFG